ncbi:hypothetical protein FSC37_03895 [Piscinibacter aquaticus]|uniref:DUF8082 domain-containing protein n=1 Tax=Piscinibacter aquaticus TaxID=392597 RepID=A0A5C6TZA2_9BURK|nr:hypothetical protein FSC37_03895 [Piscinibacter aquaticus]
MPAALDAVVARAMAKRADERFADAAQMRTALAGAATATGTTIAARLSAQTMDRLRARRSTAPTQRLPRAMAVMPRGSTPAPSVPASTPSLPGWDAKALMLIEQLLLPQLGPMTRHVVRSATRRAADLPALLALLADEVLEPAEREPFLTRAKRLLPAGPGPGPALPVLGSTPMQPALIEQAARELAVHIGPIALVLARRAAAQTTTREAFFAALVDAAGEGLDRKALLRRLWQLP